MKSLFKLSNILANNAGAAFAAACHMLQQHVLRRKVNHNIYKLYQCYSSSSRALPHAEQLHMAHESAACAQVCVCVCRKASVKVILWKENENWENGAKAKNEIKIMPNWNLRSVRK